MRSLPALLFLCLIAAAPATAQTATGSAVNEAVEALQRDNVYVAPGTDRVSEGEADRLRVRIANSGAAPLYLAVLPESARNEAGGSTSTLVGQIGNRLVAEGAPDDIVVAVVAGGQFRVGGPRGTIEASTRAAREHEGDLVGAIGAFVDEIGRLRQGGAASGSRDGRDTGGDGGTPWILYGLLGAGGAAFFVSRRNKKRVATAELAEVKGNVRDELVALGEDIGALDLDVQMPGADPQAVADYQRAVEAYQRGEDTWERARSVEELEGVGAALEEGRWAMASAKARLNGQAPPERRPPCFFDPRHGPSDRDVEWAPPGGQPRPVPACAADALAVEEGQDPASREIMVGGQRMPMWQAGPAYAPFMGGFFGASLFPMLMMGTMMGGMFGPGIAYGDSDIGGGGFGDGGGFGSGGFGDGGGFGGGDFGGGGGGGDF
jgi:LPXTG-motif cell wall-anchored protein